MARILFIPCMLVWAGCGSTIPDWVTNHPTDTKYWHGIGYAEKIENRGARQRAKEAAIHEVSSQIKVNISSEMKIVIQEADGSLKTATSSIMKSRVDLLLPELEMMGQYQTKEDYYFYVRLNKQKYHAAMARLRENAKETAIGYVRDADENFGAQSFNLLQKAWQEIFPFSDEPIQIRYEGKQVHLYSLIKRKMDEYAWRIQLVGSVKKKQMKTYVDRDNSVQLKVTDRQDQTPISGVPVLIRMGQRVETQYTNRNGEIVYDMAGISPNASFEIRFQLDNNELFKEFSQQHSILELKPKTNTVQVQVIPVRAKLEAEEKNMGRTMKDPMIAPAIKEAFSGQIEFVNRDPDMLIKIESNTNKKSERVGENYPYFSYGNASVIFRDARTNEEFFSSHLSNVKGGDFGSNQIAGIRAYEIMVKQVVKELEEQLLND